MQEFDRNNLCACRRVLVKIGSRVLKRGDGLNYRVIERLCDELCLLKDSGREFALVSSGAIAAGSAIVRCPPRPGALSRKQALAAIGQGRLIHTYTEAFQRYGHIAAQVLITREDLDDRLRYLNIRNTFLTLLEMEVIPIVNENDTVSVDEIQFSDNDMLSAMIIPLVEAQAMIILTDTEGVYVDDPRKNPEAERIACIRDLKLKDVREVSENAGELGRGGMRSKLKAAYHAARLGVPTVIASAYTPGVLNAILGGADVGTLVTPKKTGRLSQKDHWISLVSRPKGSVKVDDGAASMILTKGKSLLPCGVLAVEGAFKAGDPVQIVDERGEVLAVGLSNFTRDEVYMIRGANSRTIATLLGKECDEEVVHRNNMIVKKELP